MQTALTDEFTGTREGTEAEAILRKCVHCGFCTATCPTYQVLGDELDGPRGRIYLIKQVLEGAAPTQATQLHLDRCLTCRNCESTCPSGVQYGQLVEIGRNIVERKVQRPATVRAKRWLLKEGLTSPLFAPAMKLGRALRPLVPAGLRDKVPAASATPRAWPTRRHPRRVLMLGGCVQPAMMPNINAATARVLDAAGWGVVVAAEEACCGAIHAHLGDPEGARVNMRRNIDAWWPEILGGDGSPPVEAIVMNASGCGAQVKGYGHALADDPAYAEKAARVSALTRDLSELLPQIAPAVAAKLEAAGGPAGAEGTRPRKLVFHPPCTLQHGQQLRGGVETWLRKLGWEVSLATAESHLCCGSAGTYSVLQPEMAKTLRDRKLGHLEPLQPQVIVSANIGCIQHLQSGTPVPVRHWVELLDDALTATD